MKRLGLDKMDRALASRRHGPAAPWSPHTGTGETRTLLSDPPHTELAQNVLSNTKGDLSYANSARSAASCCSQGLFGVVRWPLFQVRRLQSQVLGRGGGREGLGFHVGHCKNLTGNPGPHRVLPRLTANPDRCRGRAKRLRREQAGGHCPALRPTWPYMPPHTSKSLAASASEEVTDHGTVHGTYSRGRS